MTIQTAVAALLASAAEAAFGSPAGPTAVDARVLRRVSSTLTLSKDAFTSAEVRADQQIADMRHGTRRGGGSIEGELSVGSYNVEMEAALRGTLATLPALTQAAFTSIAADNAAGTFTFGGSDPVVAGGLRVGDVIRVAGAPITLANTLVNYRIVSFSGASNRIVTVSPPPPATQAAQTTFSVSRPGKKVINGVQRRSFTIEQNYPEIDVSEVFYGCRVGSMAIRLPPTGMATISMDVQAQDGAILSAANAPYFTGPAGQATTGVLAAVNGAIRVAGADVGIVTGLDINISNNLSATPVVGSNKVPDIFYGRIVVTGNISVYLESRVFLDLFNLETEFDIVGIFEAAGAAPLDFVKFGLQKVKMTGNSKSVGADGGIIVSFPWQGLIKPPTAGFESTTIDYQSSI